ncbi:hypothetical protein XarjCFBP8253_18235 [Xanthomonas arboricola pv. juglandis]|nr:hypothetical protein XarbCFBP8132_06510 [Xanthomonas arboricola]PPT46031.1 hypothetical protein XarjCFBP7652_18935 [Xanthomonas arboricola]PPT97333.1 hypothetical protein XarjCFBP8253_18235 [Xanthomonas arboricola pv. juglandis]
MVGSGWVRSISFPAQAEQESGLPANNPKNAAKRSLPTDQFSGAVSSPVAGPLAAWMPPRSLHGRIHGVSRKR